MKRPLAVVGFTMLICLSVLCIFDSIALTLVVGLVSYVLFMASCFISETRNKLTLPTVFFTAVIACFMFYMVQGNYAELSALADNDSNIICRVQETPVFNKEYGRYYCKAEVLKIDGEKYNGNIRLSFNTTYDDLDVESFEIGNKLSFKGHLYKVGGENDGIVDYFKSEKIYIGVYGIKDMTVLQPKVRPISYYGEKLRSFIAQSYNENFSRDTAGFLTALLTGSKDYLSERVYDNFKNSGIAHIMAVSGMHLSVMVLLLDFLLKRLKKRFKVAYFVIMCLFVLLIMFVAAFSSSVVRAGVMMLLMLTGQLVDKRSDSLNSLGFACICILLHNPFSAMSVGFLLSVVSVWSIIAIAVPFCRRYRYLLADKLELSGDISFAIAQAVVFSVVVSLCVMVCTLPIMASNFGAVSVISPITNLLLLPVTMITIYMALISAVLCGFGIMPHFLAYITEKLSQYCLWVAEIFGSKEIFVIKTDSVLAKVICCLVPLVLCIAIKTVPRLYRKLNNKRKPL